MPETTTDSVAAAVDTDPGAVPDLADLAISESSDGDLETPYATRQLFLRWSRSVVDVPEWYGNSEALPAAWVTEAREAFVCGNDALEQRRMQCYLHWMQASADPEVFTEGDWRDLHPAVLRRVVDEITCMHRWGNRRRVENLCPVLRTGSVITTTECLDCGHIDERYERRY
jgi:hypothetical protein